MTSDPIKLTQPSTLSVNNDKGFMWAFSHDCFPWYLLSFYPKYTLFKLPARLQILIFQNKQQV